MDFKAWWENLSGKTCRSLSKNKYPNVNFRSVQIAYISLSQYLYKYEWLIQAPILQTKIKHQKMV